MLESLLLLIFYNSLNIYLLTVFVEDNLENSKTLSNQEVAYYELALGTDRRFPKTRDNIVPFVNVGLNKTHTFFDLDDLIPYKAVYYFTVRAHSTSGARTQITSNGFSVGYDGGVEGLYTRRKEGNVLFNDTLNTFYLWLYCVGHMIKDHSDSENGRKEGNVLFNDTLNTFYLRLYGVGHMVKDHSDSESKNLLPPHGLLFPISSKGSFICTIPQTG